MRWLLLLVALAGLLLAVFSNHPSGTVVGALLFVGGSLGWGLAIAQERIGASARPESLNAWELQQMRADRADPGDDG